MSNGTATAIAGMANPIPTMHNSLNNVIILSCDGTDRLLVTKSKLLGRHFSRQPAFPLLLTKGYERKARESVKKHDTKKPLSFGTLRPRLGPRAKEP